MEKLTKQEWTAFKEGAIENTSSDTILSANLGDDFGDHNRYLEAIVSCLIPNWKTEVEYYKEVENLLSRSLIAGMPFLLAEVLQP